MHLDIFFAEKDISGRIKASLICQSNRYSGIIRFYNTILLDRAQNKSGDGLQYEINQSKIKVSFDLLNDISEHITLVQLMGKVDNMDLALNV